MNRARWWAWALTALHASVAFAYGNSQCVPEPCTGSGGCLGEKICLAGGVHSSTCACDVYPCQTACGSTGYPNANGVCVAREQCNGCDDDNDGAKDEGLDCTGNSLIPTSCDPSQPVPGHWDAAEELEGVGSEDSRRIAARMMPRINIYASANTSGVRVHYQSKVGQSDGIWLIDKVGGVAVPLQKNSDTSLVNYFWYGADVGSTLQFQSYEAAQSETLRFSEFTPLCATTPQTPVAAPLTENGEQILAMLSKQPGSLIGDTVFFAFTATGDQTAIWTDGRGISGDIDLYVAVDHLPDKTTPLLSTRTGSASEIVRSKFPAGSRVFVAVHARTAMDSGLIRVRMATQKPQLLVSQKICTTFKPDPSKSEEEKIRAIAAEARASFWAMTEGKGDIVSFDFNFGSCPVGCNVCISDTKGRAHAWLGLNVVWLYDEWKNSGVKRMGATLTHEWGHSILSLPDEYADHGKVEEDPEPWWPCHSDTLCPLSKMSRPRTENICTEYAHGKTPVIHTCTNAGNTPPAGGNDYCQVTTRGACNICTACNSRPANDWTSSAWQILVNNGKANQKPFYTPELFDYSGFPL